MATNYIKVSPYVAQKLGVIGQRFIYADGNVQLWEKDLSLVDRGYVFRLAETVAAIGGVLFDPYSNRDEQRKSAEECTPLPIPTDPEWIAPEPEEEIEEEIIEEEIEEAVEELVEEELSEIEALESDVLEGGDE